MPKLIRISYRELAAKLRRAGYVEIRTKRHPVYYLAENDITIPVPRHPGDAPIGTLRAIIREMGISIEEFNSL
ncbi:MAG: type II toxin-antitoxin system HicA family toxin [Candidatus Sumerlaeota bacterium]|nr:type II toxin-antitoxin system HicA family toxin [Candidatus Sumerlaeota bacterium]